MISKHLLPIGLLFAVASSSLPATVLVAAPTSPGQQNPLASAVMLVFQLQRVPGTTMNQNIKTTIQVFKKRLKVLGYANALLTNSANKLMVKIPGTESSIDTQLITKSLLASSTLTFAAQKLGTDDVLRDLIQERMVIQGTIRELYTRSAAEELYGAAIKDAKKKLRQTNVKISRLFKSAGITDRNVIDAQVESSTMPNYESMAVALKFDAIGAKGFTALTKKLAGTGRSIGIFVNDELYSYPVVDAQYKTTGISGGSAVINGNFTKVDAESLALSLNSGKLPAPIKLLGIDNSSGN
jgi:preprotein translocase subunit SecD